MEFLKVKNEHNMEGTVESVIESIVKAIIRFVTTNPEWIILYIILIVCAGFIWLMLANCDYGINAVNRRVEQICILLENKINSRLEKIEDEVRQVSSEIFVTKMALRSSPRKPHDDDGL